MRAGDLVQLVRIADGFASRTSFLTELTLDPPQATSDLAGAPLQDDDYLVLSTIHSAKGQEWRSVFVLNCVDGCIPSDLATGTAEEIEEERRLFYVAMTRAKDALHLMLAGALLHPRPGRARRPARLRDPEPVPAAPRRSTGSSSRPGSRRTARPARRRGRCRRGTSRPDGEHVGVGGHAGAGASPQRDSNHLAGRCSGRRVSCRIGVGVVARASVHRLWSRLCRDRRGGGSTASTSA